MRQGKKHCVLREERVALWLHRSGNQPQWRLESSRLRGLTRSIVASDTKSNMYTSDTQVKMVAEMKHSRSVAVLFWENLEWKFQEL